MAEGTLDPQGPAAQSMAGLWWLMLALGLAVFVIFAVVLAAGLFRRRPPEEAEPGTAAPSRVSALMVGAGVAFPLVVIGVVFAATVQAMRDVATTAPPGALVIDVVGHQWWWEVRYPEEEITTANEIHVPVGRDVALRLTSADVIHSFWVPELGGKLDMLPDGTNTLVLRADEPGEHVNRCAEYCGLQHTLMQMVVVAEPQEQFDAWSAARRLPAAEPTDPTERAGKELFLGAAGCASCHSVRGTAAAGEAGPDLTHFASRPTLGAGPFPNTPDNRAEWVSDPHAVKRGVAMPAAELAPEDLEAVLAYLELLR